MTILEQYGVSPEIAKGFINHFEEVSGVLLTQEALALFMEDNPGRSPSLAWWRPDVPEIGDQIASDVAEYICDQPWPRYGDNRDLDAFLVVLRASSVIKGYRITSWRTYGK